VLHRGCDPNPDGEEYWIAVERIRTATDVIWWSAHLLGKNWIEHTNWGDVLRGIARRLRLAGAHVGHRQAAVAEAQAPSIRIVQTPAEFGRLLEGLEAEEPQP
jgi:hypothetical protein